MNNKQKEAVVLYSGGLDSRLTIMLLQDQGFKITALYFNLPYGCGCCNVSCNFNFTQREEINMKIFDVTKEPYLTEYLKVISNPKYGTGTGINPCKDCKIYIFIKAKEYADENGIEVIATGEVLGQRPMSQVPRAMHIIDDALGFEILRPLSAKLLPETSYEKKGLVDRSKLLDIQGRRRIKQMALADEYSIKYPSPGGGCFLCEKEPSKRLKKLFEKNLVNENTLPLSIMGRHFMKDDIWFVVARNSNESAKIESYKTSIMGIKGQPSVYFSNESGIEYAKELQKAYSTGASLEKREIMLVNKLQ
ncbi:MAG: tRNA 4-thiouridine(8) synthase ThiI [Nanoarchaeota archaeon]|nr:tRNA 4-thiouridine(8) synthase ThiI [Nanoarchaeota archaeon]